MQLTNSRRKQLFNQARSINPNLEDLFQNEMNIDQVAVDTEFDALTSFEFELQNYKKQLFELKGQVLS